jgi:hypothetical protein
MILFHFYNNKERDCSLKNHKRDGSIKKPTNKTKRNVLKSRSALALFRYGSNKKNNSQQSNDIRDVQQPLRENLIKRSSKGSSNGTHTWPRHRER